MVGQTIQQFSKYSLSSPYQATCILNHKILHMTHLFFFSVNTVKHQEKKYPHETSLAKDEDGKVADKTNFGNPHAHLITVILHLPNSPLWILPVRLGRAGPEASLHRQRSDVSWSRP